MPQMSPMLWFNLYFYFMFIFLMVICLIYFMVIFYKFFSQSEDLNKNLKFYSLKW